MGRSREIVLSRSTCARQYGRNCRRRQGVWTHLRSSSYGTDYIRHWKPCCPCRVVYLETSLISGRLLRLSSKGGYKRRCPSELMGRVGSIIASLEMGLEICRTAPLSL